jgi:predicted RNA-binding Zn-ribbon protein involved in translation (DUF1610 family)
MVGEKAHKEEQTAVMTPVFSGTSYIHHLCSECGGQIKFRQSCYGGVNFYEICGVRSDIVKFCPLCGAEIVRFSSNPIYESAVDLSPLDVFAKLHREYERKAHWLYHCYISDSHRDAIDALISLLDKKEIEVYYQDAIDMAKNGRFMYTKNSRDFAKLRKESGEEKE